MTSSGISRTVLHFLQVRFKGRLRHRGDCLAEVAAARSKGLGWLSFGTDLCILLELRVNLILILRRPSDSQSDNAYKFVFVDGSW